MLGQNNKDISRFCVVGINYRKTDVAVRGSFAINEEQYLRILHNAATLQIQELFILSTCNRTEIYGVTDQPELLGKLICTETEGDLTTFQERSYKRTGEQAITHLFKVAAGIDSQILGDYEIVGQIKQAAKIAKERGFIGSFLERLLNQVLQSSKEIKNSTVLSGGTVSVSFAAVQYIKESQPQLTGNRILLLGIGKIGRNTCKNLKDYLPDARIILMNRTEEKATELAEQLGLQHAPFQQLAEEVALADVILVATNAPTPTITVAHLQASGRKLVIDLSIPNNVEPAVADLAAISLINVDELSKLKDETLQKREQEIPKALTIIARHRKEFSDWFRMRQHVPILIAVKEKLQEMQVNPVFCAHVATASPHASQDKIQKVINVMATKMRRHNQRGCQYIEAINDFITPAVPN